MAFSTYTRQVLEDEYVNSEPDYLFEKLGGLERFTSTGRASKTVRYVETRPAAEQLEQGNGSGRGLMVRGAQG